MKGKIGDGDPVGVVIFTILMIEGIILPIFFFIDSDLIWTLILGPIYFVIGIYQLIPHEYKSKRIKKQEVK